MPDPSAPPPRPDSSGAGADRDSANRAAAGSKSQTVTQPSIESFVVSGPDAPSDVRLVEDSAAPLPTDEDTATASEADTTARTPWPPQPAPPPQPAGGRDASRRKPGGRRRNDSSGVIDADAPSDRRGDEAVLPGERRADGSRWIWPFVLTEQIGEGGMGIVYRGEYVPKKIEVAVKMLPDDVADPVVLQRFEREVGILKKLRHPNIVRCFGGSCENERRYYAMELVPGGTLADVLRRRGSLEWEQVVEYGEQMAAALAAAHEANVVHRDLKPANFLIDADGRLKLADFGLAFIEAKSRITRAGKTAGTVLYMSPEQIRGREVGAVSDLYSLGCVLFEMLAGEPPFDGESQAAILHAHVMEEPRRVSSIVLDCPTELDQLIGELLTKDPDERIPSAEEVGERLRAIRPGPVSAGGSVSSMAKKDVTEQRSGNQPLALPSGRGGTPPAMEVPSLPKVGLPTLSLSWRLNGIAVVASFVAAGSLLYALSQKAEANRLDGYRAAWIDAASESGSGRLAALQRLGQIAAPDPDVEATIRDGLSSQDAITRETAARAAMTMGAEQEETLALLRKLANSDPSDSVRVTAGNAAKRLDD